MTWPLTLVLAALVLAMLALAPLGAVLLRRRAAPPGRREAALALHRTQLAELDRDLAEARIAPAEHATALLEVQRRMLAAEAVVPAAPSAGPRSRAILLLVAGAVPVCALGLYLIDGHPDLPGMPMARRTAEMQSDMTGLLVQLRTTLAGLDPQAPQARQGYVLLGSMETERGDYVAAAQAWKVALAAGFDPTLAARTAETLTAVAGKVTPEAASLFRRALDAAPADAPWRTLAEARLAEAR